MPISLSRDYPELPYNERLLRFHSKYWTVDYNAEMVGVILPVNDTSFRVSAQWRTNKDFLGVRWQSRDLYSHDCYAYATAVNYADTVLAFRANPAEPNKFTCTVSDFETPRTYRLAPYVLDPVTNEYYCLEAEYSTGKRYTAAVIKPRDQWTPIPEEEMEPWLGRTDYIFILDFNDLRTGANYGGTQVSPVNVSQISFDTVESTSGLGNESTIVSIVQQSPSELLMVIAYTQPGVKLTNGDQLQFTYLTLHPQGGINPDGSPRTITHEGFAVVKEWSGFGTGELTVLCNGVLPGVFYRCDAFYTRFLQATSPTAVIDSNKYFYDMTVTGNHTLIGLRNYPQPEHSLMMTSGFDDNYPQTPERQIEMVYKLGYRGFWNVYIGMSHYFSAHAGWRDAVTGDLIVMNPLQTMTTLFCGDEQALGQFNVGALGLRGVDAYTAQVASAYGIPKGLVRTINGATIGTATERMAAQDPNALDFNQGGGLWWWDIEANTPGPALRRAVANIGRRTKPGVVIWAIGEQDASAFVHNTDRVPAPSPARTLVAMRSIFAYMRALWGSNLLIEIQQTGWSWDENIGSTPVGAPCWMSCSRNGWGDVEFKFLMYKVNPAGKTLQVEIMHPDRPNEIMRTLTVPGSRIYNGFITADYPVELNVPDAVATRGDQFPWEYLRWRVRVLDTGLLSPMAETLVPLDNNSFVKKMVLLGINSLIGGYFNDLSDPLNPGGTGKPGRKDVVAASTFRKKLAATLGIRDIEVMPVMTVIGSSPINPMPYQPGFPLDNYWWDAATNSPGPNLAIANDIVQQLGRAPDYFIESGPGETTGIVYAPDADHPAILAAWKSSNIAMLNWMRANWGNPTIEIWFQGATTSFWGLVPPPQEVNFKGAYLLRRTQVEMATSTPGFKLGSYVPNGGSYTTYRNEMLDGLGWVHYTVDGYHAAADEMGLNIGLDRNIALLPPPDWVTMLPPTGLRAQRQSNQDIHVTWDDSGADSYVWNNFRADTQALMLSGTSPSNLFVYTLAMQEAAYGGPAGFVIFEVAEFVTVGSVTGPFARFEGVVEEIDLPLPTNLRATRMANDDIRLAWDSSGADSYVWRNYRADTQALISSGTGTDLSAIFTVAQQNAEYSGLAGFVIFEVAGHMTEGNITGPFARYEGGVSEVVVPLPTGLTGTRQPSNDLVFNWNAVVGATYRVINYHVGTGAVLSSTDQAVPTWTFTLAEQVAAYGFESGAGYVNVHVRLIIDGFLGEPAIYNGAI